MLGICTFVEGRGTGGTEKRLEDTYDEYQCANIVRSKGSSANGATWGNNGDCYAEFGATDNDNAVGYQTCLFEGQLLVLFLG